MEAPPKTSAVFRRVNFASRRISASIWVASSRVGASTRARGPGLRVSSSCVEQRQRERRRLAGASLGEAQHVGPFEGRGNCLDLNGPRLDEPRGAYAAREVRVKLEPVEAGYR